MDLEDLTCLVAVDRAGSISAVAKARGVSVSTVARRLDALEARLRLTLLDRGRDGVRTTEDGRRILALARPLVEGGDQLARIADALREGRRDEVVVSATELVVSDILAPALPLLQRRAPGLRLDLRSQASVVSLAGREADLAIRMSAPEGASLVARKLGAIALGLFASPAYLGGRSLEASALADERLLVYDDSYGRLPQLEWVSALGLGRAVICRTNSTRALLAMAAAGAGVALLPCVFAVRAGLVQVATDLALPARIPWLVTHADLKGKPDLKLVRRWIVDCFAELS